MAARFEELAWAQTPIGELSLRRRREPVTGTEVHEVNLGEQYLMSSLFTVAEEELARLALARLEGEGLRVVVGGLGLGYTARAVLEDDRVADLVVVDALEPVLDWHRQGLVPLGAGLGSGPWPTSSTPSPACPTPTRSASSRSCRTGCTQPTTCT